MRISYTALFLVPALCLSACGPGIDAPSLGLRMVEKQSIDMPAAEASEPTSSADPQLQAEIAKYIDAADAGDKEFAAQRDKAETVVAKAAGKPAGSEEWAQAQESITALELARHAVRDAAAAIDALRDNPVYASGGNRDAIDAAAKHVSAIEENESSAVAGLTGKLG